MYFSSHDEIRKESQRVTREPSLNIEKKNKNGSEPRISCLYLIESESESMEVHEKRRRGGRDPSGKTWLSLQDIRI